MERLSHYVLFSLSGQRYALPLSSVERVVRAVEITPLPEAPEWVLGVANVHGRIVPVVDLRRRLRLAARDMEPSDQFVLARTPGRTLALLVDSVMGVLELSEPEMVPVGDILRDAENVESIAKTEDGLTLAIQDLDGLVSPGERTPVHPTREA